MFNKGNEQKNCQNEKNGYLKVAFFLLILFYTAFYR